MAIPRHEARHKKHLKYIELDFDNPKSFNLKKGMEITFCGTPYVINKVLDYDTVEVILGNGHKENLWINRNAGCKIIKDTRTKKK